jgi:hypothetical protein
MTAIPGILLGATSSTAKPQQRPPLHLRFAVTAAVPAETSGSAAFQDPYAVQPHTPRGSRQSRTPLMYCGRGAADMA